ncbi:MAG: hypothetical protein EOO89_12600 [Pedobacter sp.]|nr:MAG: hypothetical protein EOO89_12600 [Pedobacter sp.]
MAIAYKTTLYFIFLFYGGVLIASAQGDAVYVVNTQILEGKHIEPIGVTEKQVQAYIVLRPGLRDTTGKKLEIIKTLAAANMLVKYGAQPDLASAIAKVEYYNQHKNDVDKILVVKHQRIMHLMKKGKILKSYPIALGWNPVGQKYAEGDGRTPEGIYTFDTRTFYKQSLNSFHISYPNTADKARSAARGVKTGTNIMVHGTDGPKKKKDFTNGCIALSNTHLADLAKRVFIGTVIEIVK